MPTALAAVAVDKLENVLLWTDTTLERWLSGRKRQIANLLIGSGLSEGSNPSLSVEYHQLTDKNILSAKIQLSLLGKAVLVRAFSKWCDPKR